MTLDFTHDPARRSWVGSANADDGDFPIQNLPFGRFRIDRPGEPWRAGVAIGDEVLDLHAATARASHWAGELPAALVPLAEGNLNAFMALGGEMRRALRHALSHALVEGSPARAALEPCLVPQADIELSLPCHVGDYTDFYTGIHHATTVGSLFRPDQPLLPNYKWVPIGYHGRASSIVPSGHAVQRPLGQIKPAGDAPPQLGATQRLDYELELGLFIGRGNALGTAIDIDSAEDHLFGLVLLNDWSARDIQAWEYQPLGPFLAKNFATTISPWIVTLEALAPFRRPFARAAGEPQPLPYLDGAAQRAAGGFDITLEAWLETAAMRADGTGAVRLSRAGFAEAAYWSPAQLVTHHTVNGCNLAAGDLLGTGTLSGPQRSQAGSLLELSAGGKQPVALPNGEQRGFLADGDTLRLRAWCEAPGARRIGFGDCVGTVVPARDLPTARGG